MISADGITRNIVANTVTMTKSKTTLSINNNQTGPFAQKYYTAIPDIQYGKAEDPMGWIEPVA